MLWNPYYKYEEKRKKKWGQQPLARLGRCPQGSVLFDPIQKRALNPCLQQHLKHQQQHISAR
jgi:hypothetical protein